MSSWSKIMLAETVQPHGLYYCMQLYVSLYGPESQLEDALSRIGWETCSCFTHARVAAAEWTQLFGWEEYSALYSIAQHNFSNLFCWLNIEIFHPESRHFDQPTIRTMTKILMHKITIQIKFYFQTNNTYANYTDMLGKRFYYYL